MTGYLASSRLQANFPFLFGKEIKEHVLINNWANGWQISPTQSGSVETSQSQLKSVKTNIVIVFLPQYLQFIGFGLLIGTFVGIFFWKEKK